MVKIRLIKSRDLNKLAKVYTKVYAYFDVGERWTNKTSYNLLKYWLERQPDLFMVAEINNKPVGAFVAGIKPWWNGNNLVDGEVFVDPEYQGRGIGNKLAIAIYEKALKKYCVVSIGGITFKDKKFPLSWYKSQGFKEVKNLTIISGDIKKALKKLRT